MPFLIVVGDFEQKQLDGWIDKYFGKIAKPTGEHPACDRGRTGMDDRTAVQRIRPAGSVSGNRDRVSGSEDDQSGHSGSRLAASILSGGESSRMYQIARPEAADRSEVPISISN